MALDGLATLASRENVNGNPKLCDTCWLLHTLDADDAANLEAALRNTGVKYTEIHDLLHASGYDVDANSLRRHARGRCAARVVYRGGAV